MPTPSTIVRPPNPALRQAVQLAALFALVKLLFQFALTIYTSHIGYGYFRDEFYYIACGRHLAWGYVDQGPIVAVQARIGEILFGDTIFAIRILSAAAGAAMVFLGGLIAWAMGGRRPAQALTMISLLVASCYIGIDGFLSMNSFEAMFWMGCVLALSLILRGGSEKFWWVFFGISAGLGLLNKPSMTFFLVAIGLGLLLTPQRRLLFTRWAALGVFLLVVIALPNLLWQIHNHWPTLEFLHNGQIRNKNVALNPIQFLLAQLLQLHPITALVWVTGVVSLLRAKSIRDHRWLGLAYLILLPILWKLHAKDYYLASVYPALFAAGAIAWERKYATSRSVEQNRIFAFPILEAVIAIIALAALPMASPILKPDAWVQFATATHFRPKNTENEKTSALPQFYADRFGWEAMVSQVANAYRALPAEDQARACIWASNYGEAGAVDLLGPRYDAQMPQAISGHNNYWIWGTHGCTWDVVIGITGATPAEMAERYESVQIVGRMDDPMAMPFEHRNIYLLRHRKPSMPVVWSDWKDYI